MLIARGIRFPYTHHLQTLLDLIPAGLGIPDEVRHAALPTDFAVGTRYPAAVEPVEVHEHEHALELAAACIDWAERLIATPS